jgi:hypothetical protein
MLLIVGGGMAAAEAAKTLRDEGYDDRRRPDADADVWIRREGSGYVALWIRNGRAVAGIQADAWETKPAINAIVEGGAPVERAAFEHSTVPLDEVAGAAAAAAG